MANKPTVQCTIISDIILGSYAIVKPKNHPYCSNTKAVITSPVVKKNEDGSFETQNTHYVPEE